MRIVCVPPKLDPRSRGADGLRDPLALFVVLIAAAFTPLETGLNFTGIEQLAFAASVVPRSLLKAKSSACPPVRVMAFIEMAPVPILDSVAVLGAEVFPTEMLVNESDVTLRATDAALAATPDPLGATTCGYPVALSAIDKEAAFVPVDTGVNVMDTVQLAPAASVDPQVFVKAKLSAWLPAKVIEERSSSSTAAVGYLERFRGRLNLDGRIPK